MTNFERYKSDIEKLRKKFALDKHTMKAGECTDVTCMFCLFHDVERMCTDAKFGWLCEECQDHLTDWAKVPIDTKVLVSDNGITWYKEHFAGVNGKGDPTVYAYGRTSWSWREHSVVNRLVYKYIKLAEEE